MSYAKARLKRSSRLPKPMVNKGLFDEPSRRTSPSPSRAFDADSTDLRSDDWRPPLSSPSEDSRSDFLWESWGLSLRRSQLRLTRRIWGPLCGRRPRGLSARILRLHYRGPGRVWRISCGSRNRTDGTDRTAPLRRL